MCNQLQGTMPLPTDTKNMSQTFGSLLYEIPPICNGRFWLPAMKSPENESRWLFSIIPEVWFNFRLFEGGSKLRVKNGRMKCTTLNGVMGSQMAKTYNNVFCMKVGAKATTTKSAFLNLVRLASLSRITTLIWRGFVLVIKLSSF